MINRGQLPAATESEFNHLMSRLRSIWLAEHNEDGTHIVSSANNSLVPIGSIVAWPIATAPANWVLCNNQQLSRVKYKSLFDIIGTTYGVGDGSTTFNVPDLRQKFILGLAAAGTGSTLAGTGGAIDHTHSHAHTHSAGSYAAASHLHTVDPPSTASSSTSIAHTHTFSGTTDGPNSGANIGGITTVVPDTNHTHDFSGTTSSSGGSHSHNVDIAQFNSGSTAPSVTGTSGAASVSTTGGGNPPFVAMPYIIHTGVTT
jgi:microcystin-dependent protein